MNLITMLSAPMKEWEDFTLSHPSKSKANGIPVTTIPLVAFVDDTSGNKSKKWNKFTEWNISHLLVRIYPFTNLDIFLFIRVLVILYQALIVKS